MILAFYNPTYHGLHMERPIVLGADTVGTLHPRTIWSSYVGAASSVPWFGWTGLSTFQEFAGRKRMFWGWLYGMEMDSYKSWILDGVLVQKRNRMSRCLKLHLSVSQFFGTKCTHSHVPGLKGEALFSKLQSFFAMSADRRSVRIRI